ncbi:hypothetical protein [Candidatus Protofrankia californiensis]|uniref:hypothetical protein n=1 Tax=Candidatus Protofrankia californiensis TaxID=1839754 RepID=UPI0013EC98E9|nr:hypothetical protein [Candidatus Protofrankia californiensis]
MSFRVFLQPATDLIDTREADLSSLVNDIALARTVSVENADPPEENTAARLGDGLCRHTSQTAYDVVASQVRIGRPALAISWTTR